MKKIICSIQRIAGDLELKEVLEKIECAVYM